MNRLFLSLIALGSLIGTSVAEDPSQAKGAKRLPQFSMELNSALTVGGGHRQTP